MLNINNSTKDSNVSSGIGKTSQHLEFAFRIVHIDNIPHIWTHGIVHATSPNKNPDYVSIGDPTLIDKRKDKPITGKTIGDYIPFYLGPRSPMLYVIQKGNNVVPKVDAEDIVYCVIRLQDIIQDGIKCQFTDGHAVDSLSNSYPGSLLASIDNYVRYADVYAQIWTDDEIKRRKQAELLLEDDLPARYIEEFIVCNSGALAKLKLMGIPEDKISIKPDYYY